jgi:hypothetical protein
MRINQSEIIDGILEHIRQNGGDLTEWWVGTAKEMQGPGIREQGTARDGPQILQDRSKCRDQGLGKREQGKDREGPQTLENRSALPNIISREAYTPYAADGVIDYLKGLGLHRDPQSTRGSFVLVYRPAAAHSTPQPALSPAVESSTPPTLHVTLKINGIRGSWGGQDKNRGKVSSAKCRVPGRASASPEAPFKAAAPPRTRKRLRGRTPKAPAAYCVPQIYLDKT